MLIELDYFELENLSKYHTLKKLFPCTLYNEILDMLWNVFSEKFFFIFYFRR